LKNPFDHPYLKQAVCIRFLVGARLSLFSYIHPEVAIKNQIYKTKTNQAQIHVCS